MQPGDSPKEKGESVLETTLKVDNSCPLEATDKVDRKGDSLPSQPLVDTKEYKEEKVSTTPDLKLEIPKKKRRMSLNEHRVFTCPDCDKTFNQQAHLNIHQRKHTGERPYVCGFQGCAKSFTQLGNLKTHERRHTGERPFKCSFPGCDKRFSQMGNMKTHEQLHLGTKQYQCEYPGCCKSFTQLGNLKSHLVKIHQNEKKFDSIPQKSLPLRKRKIHSSLLTSTTLPTVSPTATSSDIPGSAGGTIPVSPLPGSSKSAISPLLVTALGSLPDATPIPNLVFTDPLEDPKDEESIDEDDIELKETELLLGIKARLGKSH